MTEQLPSSPAIRAIAACVRGDVPVLAVGEPGEAKSAKLSTWLRAWGHHVETLNGSTREASDFLGLPTIEDGATEYAPLAWVRRLNAHERSALILEEFTTASDDTMKAMLRGLEERVWGDTPVTTHCPIVVIANPPSVAVGAYGELPAPIANRMCHIPWDFDFDEWADGMVGGFENLSVPPLDTLTARPNAARRATIGASVVQFLKINPAMRTKGYQSDCAAPGAGWYSPRAWHKAAQALAHVIPGDEPTAFLILKGLLGEQAAKTYTEWVRKQDLYDPEAVLEDPSIVRWDTDRPDRLYMLSASIVGYVKLDPSPERWGKAMRVMTHGGRRDRVDMAWPGTRSLLAVMPRGASIPRETVQVFGPLMERVGLLVAEMAEP